MKKLVFYKVVYCCEINVDDSEIEDVISDIDIPEGGTNDSKYCEGTFEVLRIENIAGETC